MTTLATEQWTATSSTAWPAQWVAGANNGTVSVANSRGRLTPVQSGTYQTVRRVLSGLGASSAVRETSGTFMLSAITEQYLQISGREQLGSTNAYPTGYYLQVSPAAGSWVLLGGYGTGQYGNAAAITQTFTAGRVYGYKVRVDTYTISAKLWDITGGATEPATYQSTWTDTDSAFPTGVPALSQQSGAGTSRPYAEFGPVTVTDGASGAVTGTAALSGAGTLSTTGAPAPTAPTAYSGAGSLAFSGSGKPTAATTLSGTGTLAVSGASKPATATALTGNGTLSSSGQAAVTALSSTSGTGTLSLSGQAKASGALNLSSTSGLEASGMAGITAILSTTAAGSSTAAGNPRITGDTASAMLRITGSGSLAYATNGYASGALTLANIGQLTFAGTASVSASLVLSNVVNLEAAGSAAARGTVNLTGAGALTIRTQQQSQPHTYTAALSRQQYRSALQHPHITAGITRHQWEGRVLDA